MRIEATEEHWGIVGYLEIERGNPDEPGGPDDDDLQLNVEVQSRGFSGAQQDYVTGREWVSFIEGMRRLEKRRRGEAILESVTGELRLAFRIIDDTGHTAVFGHLAHATFDGFQLRLEFGFAFDPGTLAGMVRELAAMG